MHRNRSRNALGLAALVAVVVSVAALADGTLVMAFEGMDPHIGQRLELRVVDRATLAEQARLTLPAVPMGSFELEIDGLTEGSAYRVDFYVDFDEDGAYDPPPVDHAWRLEIDALAAGEVLTFAHDTDFTDIAWPPHVDGMIADGEYRNTLTDRGTGIEVFWQNDGEMIYVGLVSPGTGWVAIGFDPERRMEGANILIAAVGDGALAIQEHSGTSQTGHREDAASQIVNAGGTETDGQTIVEFSYPLDTGARDDKPLVPGTEVAIILAYHRNSDNLSSIHTERSSNAILLDD